MPDAGTVRLNGGCGVVFAEDAAPAPDPQRAVKTHLNVHVSPALLPVLMPLLARLLTHPRFVAGDLDTHFLDTEAASLLAEPGEPSADTARVARVMPSSTL